MACLPDKNKEELAKIARVFESDAKVKAFGYNDVSTAEWLWNKYVGHPRDPKKPISPTDLKKYKLGLEEFKSALYLSIPFEFFLTPRSTTIIISLKDHIIEAINHSIQFYC